MYSIPNKGGISFAELTKGNVKVRKGLGRKCSHIWRSNPHWFWSRVVDFF